MANPLAVEHVTGVVENHGQRLPSAGEAAIGMGEWFQAGPEAIAQPQLVQELLDVGHRGAEAFAREPPVGLQGVAAAGGGHQHGVERCGTGGLKAFDQGLGQLLGLGFLPLVVAHGPAAALVPGD